MKKIINGKMYNTETATELGHYRMHECTFSSIYEALYKTKKGNYFLHGSGGPKSKYGIQNGSDICGGEEIIPFTVDQAREWAEKNLNPDKYIAEFGEVEEA